VDYFLTFVVYLCRVLIFIIFIRAILSWFAISPYNPIVVFLDRITEPILAPLRRIIPRLGMVDITPMVAIIILIAIMYLTARI